MLSPATDTKAAPGCWCHRTKGAQALSFDVGGEAGEIEADDDDEVGEDEDGALEVVALVRKARSARRFCSSTMEGGSRLDVIIAHSPFSKDHELIKLQRPNDFRICKSNDLHVMILLLEFETMG